MKKLFLGALLLACPMLASAALITYNLAGDSGDGAEGALLDGLSEGTVTKGGVSATVSTSADAGGDLTRVLNQTSSRFGINRLGDGCDASAEVDGACGLEALIFSFSEFVTLVSVTITNYSPSDTATITFENTITEGIFGMVDLPSTPSTLDIGAMVGGAGDRFALFTSEIDSSFSVDRFTIATVPEPGTTALLLLGVAALAGRRRRDC